MELTNIQVSFVPYGIVLIRRLIPYVGFCQPFVSLCPPLFPTGQDQLLQALLIRHLTILGFLIVQ